MTKSAITSFADYVALAYHEARNVRHLVEAGHLDKTIFRLLVDSMARDKKQAWSQLQPLRKKAKTASSALGAEAVFRERFILSLEDLVTLSENPRWSGTQRGGNRWAEIDRALIELRTAIDSDDEPRSLALLQHIPLLHHNTGLVGEKLRLLDSALYSSNCGP
jgi:hypothetical protein